MYFVYIIHSEKYPSRRYIGFTTDIDARLAQHNASDNLSTKAGKPWVLSFYAAFEHKRDALAFEIYLKTASGTAFARKRLHPHRR